ncbi:protein of unknown function [Saccharopolyspora antimicrobica]|uniref:Uncharacterized protein DUF4190 n=1 Tax=Saccharopolyspora antimicrobica TaxID=455193 RepID=A0A1I4QDB7_9PSEU|nr:DUF4190 domain-containing protein [Saccharopolyspora antimicrobica]RKT84875.1 uncharacterized protein DUF4190 [Saccharopolyspora antimicrobica]SFM37786.1 protein of unknown function [Saccharopolyspora antimicrobica]
MVDLREPSAEQGPRTNGLAIASLIVSVVGLISCCGGLLIGPVGAILGHRALAAVRRDPGRYGNRGLALADVIVGWIAFALGCSASSTSSSPRRPRPPKCCVASSDSRDVRPVCPGDRISLAT